MFRLAYSSTRHEHPLFARFQLLRFACFVDRSPNIIASITMCRMCCRDSLILLQDKGLGRQPGQDAGQPGQDAGQPGQADDGAHATCQLSSGMNAGLQGQP
jgi:hypothetical protein